MSLLTNEVTMITTDNRTTPMDLLTNAANITDRTMIHMDQSVILLVAIPIHMDLLVMVVMEDAVKKATTLPMVVLGVGRILFAILATCIHDTKASPAGRAKTACAITRMRVVDTEGTEAVLEMPAKAMTTDLRVGRSIALHKALAE